MGGWLDYPESDLKGRFNEGLSASYDKQTTVGDADVYHCHDLWVTDPVGDHNYAEGAAFSKNFRTRQKDRQVK